MPFGFLRRMELIVKVKLKREMKMLHGMNVSFISFK